MTKKFDPAKAERLIAPERYMELKPDVLLQRLAIPPGKTILDVGCGNGFFTFPAAAAMGDGMVIAADASEHMLALLEDRDPPDNVQILKVDEVDMDVDTDSVDAVVALFVFHEFKDPVANFEAFTRVLRSDGKILLLDWDPAAERERGPAHTHRKPAESAVEVLNKTGFKVLEQELYTEDIWLIIAQRKA